MAVLEGFGALQITTARSNGRMFGYLLTVIGPALEFPDITSATNTFFYASREFPGLGMKLQRASIEALRARGVTEVLMRAVLGEVGLACPRFTDVLVRSSVAMIISSK